MGNGGSGGSSTVQGTAGTGGAGGGGSHYLPNYIGSGGGTEIYGMGVSGDPGIFKTSANGGGGLGSARNQFKGHRNWPGGGSYTNSVTNGAVRILWGPDIAFPSTNVGPVSS